MDRPRTFDQLLHDPSPAFVCSGFGGTRELVAGARHETRPRASAAALAMIPDVPGKVQATEFYARHNGGRCAIWLIVAWAPLKADAD